MTPPVRVWANGSSAPDLPYQFSLLGVADAGCEGCSLINGLHTLTKVPGICRWQGPDFSWPDESVFGCGGVKRWVLRLDGAPGEALLLLTRVAGPLPTFWAEYELLPAERPWKVLEPNRLTLRQSYDPACAGWPSEVWVCPVLSTGLEGD